MIKQYICNRVEKDDITNKLNMLKFIITIRNIIKK